MPAELRPYPTCQNEKLILHLGTDAPRMAINSIMLNRVPLDRR